MVSLAVRSVCPFMHQCCLPRCLLLLTGLSPCLVRLWLPHWVSGNPCGKSQQSSRCPEYTGLPSPALALCVCTFRRKQDKWMPGAQPNSLINSSRHQATMKSQKARLIWTCSHFKHFPYPGGGRGIKNCAPTSHSRLAKHGGSCDMVKGNTNHRLNKAMLCTA